MAVNNPSTGSKVTSGSYTGDNTDNRAIPHGLGTVPALVIVRGGTRIAILHSAYSTSEEWTISGVPAVTAAGTTDFTSTNWYTGVQASAFINTNGTTYYWVAMG